MDDFERLGLFYLGRDYDTDTGEIQERPLLYASKELTTHAVCIGMTGSGKTGLCIGLLEEAAIDGIPSIVIDPKGDLCNLMLTFPGLTPEEFIPWINLQEAENSGMSGPQYAESQAALWREGLAKWGQDPSRIRRLRDSAEFRIYTPGSSAGTPVSILSSLSAPPPQIREDRELLTEAIESTVTSLLSLLDMNADPLQSREHIFLSNAFKTSWEEGRDLDLGMLIGMIQDPPLKRIGAMDMESFYPKKDRSVLAMRINSLLAAPGFEAWLEGEPLDIDGFLFTEEGKPKVSIFSISHLSETQRMFTVSLLLTQLVNWMRTQPGTASLRAICYMDEIFGYFPPVADPPSKKPLLTLLKQARAYGLGMVLTTQNPVDLDYKGLANTGTWFIGRLQTQQDRDRIIDGLKTTESVMNRNLSITALRDMIGKLDKRVFLLNSVHRDHSQVFHTRWALSYLRGPLTREQIKSLSADDARHSGTGTPSLPPTPPPVAEKTAASRTPPVLPPHLTPGFLPMQNSTSGNEGPVYRLAAWGIGTVYYLDSRRGISSERELNLLSILDPEDPLPSWEDAASTEMGFDDLLSEPEAGSAFTEPPPYLSDRKIVTAWERTLKNWLYRNQTLDLLKSPSLDILSSPGETERDFRIRLKTAAHEKRDEMMEKLKTDYGRKIESLENKIFTAEQRLEKEKEQQKHQKVQTTISLGATVLGALLGGGRSSVGRATTSARSASRILREKQDVELAEEKLERLRKDLETINGQLAGELEDIRDSLDPALEELETFSIKPLKKNISIKRMLPVWVPSR
ncbi:MAG: DUF87 domain-containing protein [Candidatus Fermentibacteraceae bacterium]|nr:DUF87 domain-containing protein [Candidatus Fermentibacteraceae bacterium]MBN2608571.1 DUF87 domain-containing protein [Candidatus Fermentibacteraceae bacterium]